MSIRKRLAEIEKLSGAGEEPRPGWHYVDIVDGEELSEEQRATLKHNNTIDDARCGWRYVEVPPPVEKVDDSSLATDELQ